MASLAQTILNKLLTQREMALARLTQLDADILKLREQIKEADLHERDLGLRREMGISE